ncbi:MAG: tetratricopeptide repeat protein [Myxococcales bacterium]|jgi:tetratricopeptide (TPR) repeat protein
MRRLAIVLSTAALGLAACKTATLIHPLASEHNAYGTQYLEQGLLDKAQHRFELALEYNPDYPEPYNNLCLVWIKRENYDKAKDLCIKALRLNNDFAEAYNNLGYIYLQEKSYGRAHDAFVNALKVNPGYIEARYNLCLTLLRLERGADARVCYDKVIEVNPNVADPYHDLCMLDIVDKSFADAVRFCTRAVELDPRYVSAFFHLGRAYQGAGKHCEAQEAYKQCIALDESHAECRNNLSSAARHCALASPHLSEIKDQADNEASPYSLYKLGLAEKEKGLLPEAERHFKKCLRIDGRFGLCHCQLAEIHRRHANNSEADAHCRKCLSYTTEEQMSAERDMCARLLEEEAEE